MINQLLDVAAESVRQALRAIVGHNVAVVVDEELAEVPRNITAAKVGVFSEVLEYWISLITVDIGLGHHRPRGPILLLKLLNVLSRSWLLPAKLIGRVGHDLETLIFELTVELLQALVALIRQASVGRHVYDECGLPVIAEVTHPVKLLAIDGCTRIIIEVLAIRRFFWTSNVASRGDILEAIEYALQWILYTQQIQKSTL